MTITSDADATKMFLFGMHACTVESRVGTGDSSLVLGILHVWGHAHVRSHRVSEHGLSQGRARELRPQLEHTSPLRKGEELSSRRFLAVIVLDTMLIVS